MIEIFEKIKNICESKKFNSSNYWSERYLNGGNSGPGSYGCLADFKAETINRFTNEKSILSVIEHGCGDGNQLKLSNYKQYTGYDISPAAVNKCKELFKNDRSKNFFCVSEYDGRKAELSLSLDVIFHLVEDKIFCSYMHKLFSSSFKYVIIYSSNQEAPTSKKSIHVRHRKFTDWIEKEFSQTKEWKLIREIKNPFPFNGDINKTSFSDFFFYEKIN